MIDELIVHPRTRAQLANYMAEPIHALLLVGADGIGKTTLAQQLIAHALELTAPAAQHPYIRMVTPEKNTIPIEAIRDLQRFLQLKTVGQSRYRRAVIIEHSGGLTTEAQNAFLKILEEPPADTLLVLTADTPRALLPTIRSRVQTITVQPPEAQEVNAFFAKRGKDAASIQRAYLLGGGLPGLMHALLQGDADHPLLAGVTQAKELLRQSTFERLAVVDRLAKQKDEVLHLLEALQRIARTGLSAAAQKQDNARLKQWHRIIKEVHAARQAMQYNANVKLVLTNLMLHL